MAQENGGIDVEFGITLTRLARQLAIAEARMVKTAAKAEKAFTDSNAGSARSFRKIDDAARRSGMAVNRLGDQIGGLRNILLGAFSAREIQQFADAWTVAGNKIAAAGVVAGRSGRSLEDINEIAAETRSGITETADLYAKLLRATAGVAKSEEEVARATELVNKAFKAGGAAASEQAAGILQLAQGLSSGLLQGDELRSIRENAPIVAQAIADEFGVTIGKLKELGAEGELTSDRVFRAILNAQPQIEQAFAATNATIGEGFTLLRNALTEYVGAADDSVGATRKIGFALEALAENIDVAIAAGTTLTFLFARARIAAIRTETALNTVGTAAQRATGGLAAVRGGLALLGGPVGAVIAALATLPLLVTTNSERIRNLDGAGNSAADAMARFEEATRRAADEQARLGGQVSAATLALLGQSRADMQQGLADLRAAMQDLGEGIDGSGFFDDLSRGLQRFRAEIESFDAQINVDVFSEDFARSNLARADVADLFGIESAGARAEQTLSGLADQLEKFRKTGTGALGFADMAVELQGVGDEVQNLVDALQDAAEFGSIDDVLFRGEEMARYAEMFTFLKDEVDAFREAVTEADKGAALLNLRDGLLEAMNAGRFLRENGVELVEQFRALGRTEREVALLEALLAGNTEEVKRLKKEMGLAEDAADDIANAANRIDFSAAAESAKKLAEEIGRALGAADRLADRSAQSLARQRIMEATVGQPVERAVKLALFEFDSENTPNGGSQADVIATAVAKANERRAVETNTRLIAESEQREAEKERLLAELNKPAGGGSGGGGGSSAKTEDGPGLFESSDEDIERMQRAIDMIGRTDAEISALTLRYQLLEEAKRRGLDLDQVQAETGLTLAQEIDAQAAAMGRLTEQYNQAAAQAEFFADITQQFKDGLIDSIVAGESFAGTLGNIAQQLAKVLLQAALFGEGPLATLFGQTAGSGLLSFIPGFSDGGYTGQGGKYQPAGVVHAGEYVFSKQATQAIGPGNLEALHRRFKRGYAEGGMVGGGAPGAVNVEPNVQVVFVRSEEEMLRAFSSPRGRDAFRKIASEEGFGPNG